MTDYYRVKNIVEYPSKITAGTVYRIDLENLHSEECLHTQVDSTYDNYHHWREVISARRQGQVLSGCRVVKRKGERLVNADSRPVQEVVCDPLELEESLSEWRKNR